MVRGILDVLLVLHRVVHPAPGGLALPALAQQLRLDVGVLEHGGAGAGQLLLLVLAGVQVIVLLAWANSDLHDSVDRVVSCSTN